MIDAILSKNHIDEDYTNFRDLSRVWLEKKKIKLKQSSYNKYKYLLNDYIVPQLGNLGLSEINLSLVEDGIAKIYYSNETKEMSNSLMKSIVYIINAVLTYGNRLGYLAVSKAIFELPPSSENRDISIIPHNQEVKLVSYLMNSQTDSSLGIMLSLFTGMRLGEICALKGSSIDFNRMVIYVSSTVQRMNIDNDTSKTELVVTSPKSKKSTREIPIPEFLACYMVEYGVDKLKKEYYLLGKGDLPYEPRTLQYGFEKVLKKCKIDHINFHSLRHTFATNCVKSGCDIKTISEILGHSNVSFTLNRYVHSDIDHKKSQMKKLDIYYKRAARIS